VHEDQGVGVRVGEVDRDRRRSGNATTEHHVAVEEAEASARRAARLRFGAAPGSCSAACGGLRAPPPAGGEREAVRPPSPAAARGAAARGTRSCTGPSKPSRVMHSSKRSAPVERSRSWRWCFFGMSPDGYAMSARSRRLTRPSRPSAAARCSRRGRGSSRSRSPRHRLALDDLVEEGPGALVVVEARRPPAGRSGACTGSSLPSTRIWSSLQHSPGPPGGW
jgi:hypothetical protein